MSDRAYHSDIEDLAKGLDDMTQAADALGVDLKRVKRASESLRYLSNLLHATECQRDEAQVALADLERKMDAVTSGQRRRPGMSPLLSTSTMAVVNDELPTGQPQPALPE